MKTFQDGTTMNKISQEDIMEWLSTVVEECGCCSVLITDNFEMGRTFKMTTQIGSWFFKYFAGI